MVVVIIVAQGLCLFFYLSHKNCGISIMYSYSTWVGIDCKPPVVHMIGMPTYYMVMCHM